MLSCNFSTGMVSVAAAGGDGIDDLRGNDDDEFCVVLGFGDGLEELAEDGHIADEWDLFKCLGLAIVQEAAEGKALALTELDLSLHTAHVKAGDGKAGDGYAVGKIKGTNFGRDLQPDCSARRDGGNEVEAYAELLELDGDCGCTSAAPTALDDGVGVLPAREEAALFAIHGEDIGFSQNLNDTLSLERFYRG